MSSSSLEPEQVRNGIKAERRHYQHLETNDQRKTRQQLSGAINVLQPPQEARKQQHHPCFDRRPKCKEKRCVERLVDANIVDTDRDVKSHDGIVEQVLVEFSNFLVAQENEADELSTHGPVFEVGVSDLSHVVIDARVDGEVDDLPDVLALVGEHEKPVDRNVMPQMTCWVEALALDAGDAQVIGLSSDELTCLVDISCEIRTITSKWHPKTRYQQHEVQDAHRPNHNILFNLYL